MKIYLVSTFIIGICFPAVAQEKNPVLQVIEHKGQLLIQQAQRDLANQTILQQDNSIAVLQIGHQNTLNTTIQANTSDLSYHQQGSYNEIDIASTANAINHNIYQYGDYNSFDSYSNNPSSQQTLELIQQGNKQEVSIFGENSMSKDMKITIEGNDKTLIIRNFN